MGTRSLTVVKDERGEEVIVLYRQYDGYPTGHGKELKDFLKDFRIVHGIPGGADLDKLANGMGCLAAQIVAHFKKEAGHFYLYPSGTRDCGEEFVYTISWEKGKGVTLQVQEGYCLEMKTIYEGTVMDFDPLTLEH